MPKFKVLYVVNVPLEQHAVKGVFIRKQISLASERYDVSVFSTESSSKFRGYLYLIRLLIRHSKKYDIVHAHQSLPILLSSFFVSAKAAFVGTFLSCSEHNFRFSNQKLNRFLYRYTTSRCDGVIVKNPQSVESSKCVNTILLPNSVDTELFKILDSKCVKVDIGLLPEITYLGFVSAGNVNRKEKRFELFQTLVKQLQIKGLRVEPLVISNKSPMDMVKYYNACSALVLTSDFEGSPNCVKEALSCGVPVFARDVGDVRFWIDDIPDCHVLTDSVEIDVVEMIKKLKSRELSSLQIREFYKSRALSEEQTIDKLDKLYEELVCKIK